VEILTRALGKGEAYRDIPAIKFRAPSLRSQNLLARYPLPVQVLGIEVITPEPGAYLLHKLAINQLRDRIKQEKDLDSVRLLLAYTKTHPGELERVKQIFSEQSNRTQRLIKESMVRAQLSRDWLDEIEI